MGAYGGAATPHLCGFPDQTNTGVLPGVSRDTVSGGVTLSTPGQVYQNHNVNGGITVTANNVTIKNVKLKGSINSGYGHAVTGLLIQDTEVDMNGDYDSRGILYGGYTAQRVFIHNGSDCAQMDYDVTIKDSFCAVGPDTNSDGWVDDPSGFCSYADAHALHIDGFQSDGGNTYVIDHNTIRNPCGETSAILMSSNVGAISNVQITNNLVTGGGYTIYCSAGGNHIGGSDNRFTGNRVARTWYSTGGEFGPTTDCSTGNGYQTFQKAVWDDTGAQIP
jgi:hypothetical protein